MVPLIAIKAMQSALSGIKKSMAAVKKFKGFEIEVPLDKQARAQLYDLPSKGQIDARNRWIKEHLAYNDMQYARKRVLSRVPNGPTYDAYRRSINVIQAPNSYGLGIIYNNTDEIADPKLDLIYVMPRKSRLVPTKPEILVLYRNNPLTTDTLPFTPDTTDASLVIQTTVQSKIKDIRREKIRTQYKWKSELRKHGIQTGDRQKQKENDNSSSSSVLRGARDVHTLYRQAVQTELGTPGMRAVPHWKPAYKEMMDFHYRQTQLPIVKRAIMDYSWKGWTTPIKRVKHRLPESAYSNTYKFRRSAGLQE